jgi:hypothetical protein
MGLPLFFGQIGHGRSPRAARFVQYLHALSHYVFFLHHIGDGPGKKVGAASRSRMDDHLYRFGRLKFGSATGNNGNPPKQNRAHC